MNSWNATLSIPPRTSKYSAVNSNGAASTPTLPGEFPSTAKKISLDSLNVGAQDELKPKSIWIHCENVTIGKTTKKS